MANTFTAQFAPSASMRIIDPVLYTQIAALYGFGTNIIYGVSPQTLATTYGINWVNNPVTSDYQNLPCVFTLDTQSKVLGTAVSTAANGVQTLGGQSYTDPNGQLFTSVTWEWQVEVQLYTVLDGGKFEQQVVTWTGDGTSNRLIPTTFSLASGAVGIWGGGGANGSGTTEGNFFRHNNASMAGTAVMSIGSNPLANGIVGFESGGFRVSPGASTVLYANTAGVPYTAIVCRDSTFDNRYMRVGTYIGLSGGSIVVNATHGSTAVTWFSGTQFDPNMTGQVVTDGSANSYTFTYLSATTGTISPAYVPATANPVTLTFAGGTRTVPLPTAGIADGVFATSHVWVWGSGVAYKSSDISGVSSVDLQSGANGAVPTTTMITALGTNAFSVVTAGVANQSVNTFGRLYDYISFAATSTFLAFHLFASGQATTPASLPAVVSSIGFTPQLAFGRQGNSTGFTAGAAFRGPTHTGTSSTLTANPGGSNNAATTGIVAIGSGTLSFQATVAAVTGQPFWWWAFITGSTDAVPHYDTPTYEYHDPLPIGDGRVPTIAPYFDVQTSPGPGWISDGPVADPRWWCEPVLGLSAYQISSPGTGWVACSGPASLNGWYLSTAAFARQCIIVSAGRPADPRPWVKLATWCTVGNMSVYGGAPGAACNINNHLVYPASGYTVGTDYPPIRVFNGRTDDELCRLPPTTSNTVPNAVMAMLAANGTVYFSTWDSGTTSANWRGRVMQLDPRTGVVVPLGLQFAAGEMPYALCWHMGRLWCGTNNGIGTVGKIYFFRPGIDTAWTQDHATSTDSAGGVTSMASYKGLLYVGTDNAAGSRGKVLARDTAGAYTTSLTGTGGTAVVNNGYLALTVLGSNLYASYWNKDAPVISKIEKYTGAAWSTAYTGVGTTLVPFIALALDNNELYALGGSLPYDAALLASADGTTWTDLSADLPSETATLLPMFGVVVM